MLAAEAAAARGMEEGYRLERFRFQI